MILTLHVFVEARKRLKLTAGKEAITEETPCGLLPGRQFAGTMLRRCHDVAGRTEWIHALSRRHTYVPKKRILSLRSRQKEGKLPATRAETMALLSDWSRDTATLTPGGGEWLDDDDE